MLWLIWIMIMLLVPTLAGISIWFRIDQQANDVLGPPRSRNDG